ncbi:uncharacterized protein LOC122028982 [Zingiber officinale]|uniref:Uncharacterized protein n=1 Tax=Zingiber officinale TaxID=94328 RepID=A0A8J5IPD9_ZINOF|nr:uncharacterized protein LOC122028982 [Zingiber officinale]KAG6536933.1 hypothetical protein ZIOFF_002011 [Zingiber officinale]
MMQSIRAKSAPRKPLGDVSNGRGSTLRSRKKSNASNEANKHEGAVDRLLLTRSDLANIVAQIDDIIVQVIENKGKGIKANQDLDSFRNLLSDMHSSLKPCLLRLQQSLDTTSTATKNQLTQAKETKHVTCAMEDGAAVEINRNEPKPEPESQLAVSPSPLVCWRAGTCMVDYGKQLFMLTPLPKHRLCSSKCPGPSKSAVKMFTDKVHPNSHELPPPSSIPANVQHYLTRVEEKPTAISRIEEKSAPIDLSESSSYGETNGLQLLTPCLPRRSRFLNPIVESHPDGVISELAKSNNVTEFSNDLVDEDSDKSTMENPDFFGVQLVPGFTNRRKEMCETLDWFLSPLKTCILQEPSDGKPLPTTPNNLLSLSTPFWKDLESSQKGKLPGETSLKRELWTKFEAASSNHLIFNVSIFQQTEKEGFLNKFDQVAE